MANEIIKEGKKKNNHLFATTQVVAEKDCEQRIIKGLNSIVENFVKIGYYLAYIRDVHYPSKQKDFEDYCAQTFNFSRRTVNRFVDIFLEFGKKDENGHYLCQIDSKYKGYNCSQLAEMLNMSPAQRAKTTAQSTVKEIRDLKRQEKPIVDVPAEEVRDVAQKEREVIAIPDKEKDGFYVMFCKQGNVLCLTVFGKTYKNHDAYNVLQYLLNKGYTLDMSASLQR